ncbi:transposase [Listeria booriae]|uniref:Transposase n=1 Tax=Listeria booriae TaxID=1552123 RepID=A0A7X0XEE5_9LIST|nr:transposase [Listeria booriae]MBC1492433.1 transposase [Listeria booriae]MBC1504062.1 transposase [Listeria booriae]MBC1524273.1 transposase [Listeria booriae]MBC1531104.1 transposase [Listeria booriae]MBC6135231.1 transposase [Listeria booriae]
MKRKNYSKEFKFQAISLILFDKHPVRFVSKQLEVHENTLYRWVSEYEKYGERAFPGHGSREFASQTEVKRLEKENKKLKEELELLKKFQVFLKQNHMEFMVTFKQRER